MRYCVWVFCIYLRTNSDLCHLQQKLIGFYNRDEKCLQRGTDWVFKSDRCTFVLKGLIFPCIELSTCLALGYCIIKLFSSYVRSGSFSRNNFVTEFSRFMCFKLSHVKRNKNDIWAFNTVSSLAIKEGTLTVVNL